MFQIDFSCYWDDLYPQKHTSGTYYIEGRTFLDVMRDLHTRWYRQRSLLNYHFIVTDLSNGSVFEIKRGA